MGQSLGMLKEAGREVDTDAIKEQCVLELICSEGSNVQVGRDDPVVEKC